MFFSCRLYSGMLIFQGRVNTLGSSIVGGGGAGRWMDGGKAYVITEPASGGGMQSVRIDTATGARQVLPAGPPHTPPGALLRRELALALPTGSRATAGSGTCESVRNVTLRPRSSRYAGSRNPATARS